MQGSSIKPLFNYVLIKPLEAETKTASGIVLPESAKEKPQMGQVMAVGPGNSCNGDDCCGEDKKSGSCCVEMVVKKGDRVLYKKWAGNEVKVSPPVGGEEWLLVEQKDIMAIVS